MRSTSLYGRILFIVVMTAFCLALTACTTNSVVRITDNGSGDVTVDEKNVITVCNGLIHVTTESLNKGTIINCIAEEVDNKIFLGWSYEGQIVTRDREYSFAVKEDAALNAIYCDAYTIYLDAGSGVLASTEFTVGEGQDYVLPVPTLDHAIFEGWSDGITLFTDADGKSKDVYSYDRDIILHAQYLLTPIYSVTVKYNDGSETESDNYYEGTEITVVAEELTDKFCNGWFAEIGGVETCLTTERTYTFTVDSDLYLYPKYHVAYEVVVIGGSGDGYYELGEECSILPETPAGKTFVMWRNIDTGDPVSTDENYVFNVTSYIAIEAVYE